MLIVEDLTKIFEGFVALDGVNLKVAEGQLCSVIGPNGAGKSTLFNVISGGLRASRGRVVFKDEPITDAAPHTICRKGICRSFQVTHIFPRLTVFENVQSAVLSHGRRSLQFFTNVRKIARDETFSILESVGLADKSDTFGGTLAYGDQKQLELGIVLALKPELLLLDEPTAGMSFQETTDAIDLIGRITKERGLTLLFTEHDMEVVFSISEKIIVLHQGSVIAEGSPDEIKSNEEVQRVYLGEDE
jgi:branched-chain amino acid transport system ATP-binding protein